MACKRRFFVMGGGVGLIAFLVAAGAAGAAAPSAPLPAPSQSPAAAPAAPPAPPPTGSAATPGPDVFLSYQTALLAQSDGFQKHLEAQADTHRGLLEKQMETNDKAQERFYSHIVWLAGAAVTVFGAIITVYNALLVGEAKRRVDERFDKEVDRRMQEKLTDFQNSLEANKTSAAAEVAKLTAHTDEQIRTAKQANSEAFKTLVDYISTMSFAAVILNLDPTDDPKLQAARNRRRQTAVTRLEALRDKIPLARTYVIFLSRLHEDMGDLPTAIGVLDKAIKHYETHYDAERADRGAFHYNCACYRTKLAEQYRRQSPPVDPESLFTAAWTDMGKCFDLSPADVTEAKGDEYLKPLLDPAKGRVSWESLVRSPLAASNS